MFDLPSLFSPWLNARRWYVALSGGLDSSVLLHLLHTLSHAQPIPPLCAVHIQHGLQAIADTWPQHCREVCESLGVELHVIEVQVPAGASVEQAARNARYGAFTALLEEGDVLFTGQHQDDQAETLLLRLMRGAGLRGLTGMPVQRPLGRGQLVRPLLSTSRQQLLTYAQGHGLAWVEDPSNEDSQFARNYLRGAVMPLLQQRWPQSSRRLARSAGHLSEALSVLDEVADDDLHAARGEAAFPWLNLDSLELRALGRLSPARQRNALQRWLSTRTRLPDTRHWAGWDDLRDAAADAQPLWPLTDGVLQRSQGRVWWLSGEWLQRPSAAQTWDDPTRPLPLPGNGRLSLSGRCPEGPLRVAYRQGGEVLEVPGRGRRDLKRLLNETHLPHFVRQRLPLVWQGDRLLAVANLPALGTSDLQLLWQPPTCAQGLS
ncbi:tRNA lysidine(34) synthetase TilS [Pseudomonas cremoricolorata]|uniref:tRNA(Ile)-lysidine synthase n=1 Tax=Pseudomonas cremoricolorata TaxID=157783 RepID=A0A089WKF9_9PSED|nr:tRNA lysidine(34) synthetase TilS [Pseudomonas cremoricolorata]AIR89790.1 tRNA(Ile)-lysidine synthetase [Pseudomonas cremoricolorata]